MNGAKMVLVALLLIAWSLSVGQVPTTVRAPLSVGQTLDLVFSRGFDWDLYSRGNTTSVDVLRKVVADENLEPYHRSSWMMLGMIGDASDVTRIRNYVEQQLPKVLNPDAYDGLRGAMWSLGLLSERKITGANDVVSDTLNPDYWNRIGLKLSAAANHPAGVDKYDLWILAMEGYALSGKNDLVKVARQTIDSIPDESVSKRVESALNLSFLGQLRETLESTKGGDSVLRDVAGSFNGNIDRPGPAMRKAAISKPRVEHALKPLTGDAAAPFIKDAKAAFQSISAKMVDGKFEEIKNQLLDNGKPTVSVEDWTVLQGFLQNERAVLSDPVVQKAPITAILVEQDVTLEISETERKQTHETLVVSWILRDTASIRESQLPPMPPFKSVTRTDDGSLKVVMKRIDGKWYWNPFGW